MKWLVFIAAVLCAYPAGRWLRERPALRRRAWTLLGFLPFVSALDMSLFYFEGYAGDTHGFEVAVVDWFALSLCFAYRGRTRALPFRFPLALYLVVTLASAAQARWPVLALGYAWKLCRLYLLFAAIWWAARDRRVPAAILRGMTLGIVYEGALAAWQHFGLGLFQAHGSFSHQNTLGVLVNLVVMVPIALVIAGPATLLARLAPIAAVVAALFTVSRGTLLFLGAGGALLFLASAFKRFTARKAKIGVLGLVLAAAIVPLALTTLESRTSEEKARSMKVRDRLESVALMMLQEHPLGTGPNSFQSMLLFGGYGDRAGLHWSERVAIVHNIYLLTAAEMGYAGVVALVILFLAPLGTALRYGLRPGRDRRGDVLLGLGVGLTTLYVHGFFEWIWRLTEVSYVYFMVIAIVAVVARQLRDEASAGLSRLTTRHPVPVG